MCRILPGIKKCIHIFHRNLLVQLGLPLAGKVFQCSPAYKTHFIKYQSRAAVRLHLYAKHGYHCKRKIDNFPMVKKLHFYLQKLQTGISNKETLGAKQGELCGDKKESLCFPRFQWNNSGENSPSINTNIPWEHPQCSQQGTGAAAPQRCPHCIPGVPSAFLGASCSSKLRMSSVRSRRDSPLLAVARSSRE